jgi:hypothetical protein
VSRWGRRAVSSGSGHNTSDGDGESGDDAEELHIC